MALVVAGLLSRLPLLIALGASTGAAHAAEGSGVYYQCPGNVFTNTITAREAASKGCKTREAHQPMTFPAPKSRAQQGSASPGPGASNANRIDAQEQRARDSDSRKILEMELSRAEAQLDNLKKEYNNGEPERRGDEKNYQRYLDRTSELKAAVTRTESDIAAIRREIGKNP